MLEAIYAAIMLDMEMRKHMGGRCEIWSELLEHATELAKSCFSMG